MPSQQSVYTPNSKLAKSAWISSLDKYHELYRESISDPQQFWGNISKQFHWETPADPGKFFSYNFDLSKGPIDIKWMEGSSTNISYNILDKHIKNGYGDNVAYYW
jgi:acetyl-CoA synthetase